MSRFIQIGAWIINVDQVVAVRRHGATGTGIAYLAHPSAEAAKLMLEKRELEALLRAIGDGEVEVEVESRADLVNAPRAHDQCAPGLR